MEASQKIRYIVGSEGCLCAYLLRTCYVFRETAAEFPAREGVRLRTTITLIRMWQVSMVLGCSL